MIPKVGSLTEDLYITFGFPDLTLEQLDLYLETYKPRCPERLAELMNYDFPEPLPKSNHWLNIDEKRYLALLCLRDLKRQGIELPRYTLQEIRQGIRGFFDSMGFEKTASGAWKLKGED